MSWCQVRTKLCAAFEDCLSDTMDQLWGALQYAGSKHAMVDRLKQVGPGQRQVGTSGARV